MTIEELRASAQRLRETIIHAMYAFEQETNHVHPDIDISWMDVTQFQDDSVVYKPSVRIELKVSA